MNTIAKFLSSSLLQSVMTLNFKPLDVSDEKSGQIGSVVCLVSIVLGNKSQFNLDQTHQSPKAFL